RSIDDDAALQDRRDRVEALRTVVGEAESAEVLVARERRAICEAHLQLEIAEPVERIRGTAGRDAAAVLRPRGCVLNVPELAVGRRRARHGARDHGGREHDQERDAAALHDAINAAWPPRL